MSKDAISYVNSHQGKGHECTNLVIICMDFRFHQEITDLLRQKGIEEFDLVALPGASKAVIDEKLRGATFEAIDIAVEKHHCSKVVIVDHIDCGAYGGSGQFGSSEEERKFHAGKLAEAKEILLQHYPLLEVNTYYTTWTKLFEL